MGILANSASVTMISSSADDVSSGYVVGEQVTLSTIPSGTSYRWGATIPSASASGRSALSSSSDASPSFTPDSSGVYVLTCVVDGSSAYVLTCTVADVSSSSLDLFPVAATLVPAPPAGVALFFDAATSSLSVKNPDGSVQVVSLI